MLLNFSDKDILIIRYKNPCWGSFLVGQALLLYRYIQTFLNLICVLKKFSITFLLWFHDFLTGDFFSFHLVESRTKLIKVVQRTKHSLRASVSILQRSLYVTIFHCHKSCYLTVFIEHSQHMSNRRIDDLPQNYFHE